MQVTLAYPSQSIAIIEVKEAQGVAIDALPEGRRARPNEDTLLIGDIFKKYEYITELLIQHIDNRVRVQIHRQKGTESPTWKEFLPCLLEDILEATEPNGSIQIVDAVIIAESGDSYLKKLSAENPEQELVNV